MLNVKDIGKVCKCFRVSIGKTQLNVAFDTGYSVENVSSFENGRNDNCRLLLWYFAHGMTIEHLRGLDDGKKL